MYAKELDDLIVKKPDLTEKIYFSDIKSSWGAIVEYQGKLSKDKIISKKEDNLFYIKNMEVGCFLGIDVEREEMIVFLDIVPEGIGNYKVFWYISLVNEQPKLYIDVIDQENVSVSLKRKTLALTKDLLNVLEKELKIKYSAKEEKEKSWSIQNQVAAKIKNPENNLSNSQRGKKRKRRCVNMRQIIDLKKKDGDSIGDERGYKLVFHQEIQNPDEINPRRLEKAVDRYNNFGAGTIKILQVLHTQFGNQIIFLRVGNFRALFEVPTDGSGKAHLIRILDRKDYRKFHNRNC